MNTQANLEVAHPDGVASTDAVSDCCGTVEIRGRARGGNARDGPPRTEIRADSAKSQGNPGTGRGGGGGERQWRSYLDALRRTERSTIESASAEEPAIHHRKHRRQGGNAILGDLTAGGISIKAVNDNGGSGVQAIQQALDVGRDPSPPATRKRAARSAAIAASSA